MTEIGFIIQPGQPIPDDVTAVNDRHRDDHARDGKGKWHLGGIGNDGYPWSDEELLDYAPLTVTAVREQPAEPEPVDVLDLVQQYADDRVLFAVQMPDLPAAALEPRQRAGAALFARIEAEVQRLRAERDSVLNNARDLRRMLDAAQDQISAEIEQADEHAAWATKLADAVITRFGVRLTEEGGHEVWEAALAALTNTAEQPDALVPSLPKVPRVFEVPQPSSDVTRVTLVDPRTRAVLYAALAPDGDDWYIEDRSTQPFTWVQLFVMAKDGRLTDATPAREPRTWDELPGTPEGVYRVQDAHGQTWRHLEQGYWSVAKPENDADRRDLRCFSELRELFGPLVEVFDDKDGTR